MKRYAIAALLLLLAFRADADRPRAYGGKGRLPTGRASVAVGSGFSYSTAPFDIIGREFYVGAAPLAHMWIERDQLRDDAANTHPTSTGDPVGRIDSPINGHVLWCEGADSTRPTYSTTGTMAHFAFDGVDDRLQVLNSNLGAFDYYYATGIGSILMRAGVSADGTARTILSTMATSQTSIGMQVEINASNQLVITVRHNQPTSVFSFTTVATLTAAMGIVPIEIRFNDAEGGDVRINAGELETFEQTNTPNAASNSIDLFVGSRSNGTQPCPLDLGDLLLTNTYVSDGSIETWRTLSLNQFPASFRRQAPGAPWFVTFLRRWHDFTSQASVWTDARVTNAGNGDEIATVDNRADTFDQHLGRTLTSGVGQRPTWQGDGTGALFDGAIDNFTADSRDETLGGAFTIVIVLRNDNDAAAGDVVQYGFNGSNNGALQIASDGMRWSDNSVSIFSVTPVTTATFTTVAFTRDEGGAWRARTRSGTSVVTNTRGLEFWGFGVAGTNTLDGRLVEYLRWNIALSDEELEVVFDGLDDKHPTLNLP